MPNSNECQWDDLPGANLPSKNFEWLDSIDEDNCFMTLDVSRPSKTLDFGRDGYTASITAWHQLLQLTAPDSECGVVFVRGDFPDATDSILARAQRRYYKGTFGLGIGMFGESNNGVLELSPAQGLINLRWPCTRFDVVREDPLFGSVSFASYTLCSFVKDHTFYQVARFTPASTTTSTSDGGTSDQGDTNLEIDVGGRLRFGCPSSSRHTLVGDIVPFCDKYSIVKPGDQQPVYTLACTDQCHGRRLELRLWVDGQPIELKHHQCSSERLCHMQPRVFGDSRDYEDSTPSLERDTDIFALHAIHSCSFDDNKPIVIVTTASLQNATDEMNQAPGLCISSEAAQKYLGVSECSPEAIYRLWSCVLGQSPSPHAFELNVLGRSVEQILSVAAVPVRRDTPVDFDQQTTNANPVNAALAELRSNDPTASEDVSMKSPESEATQSFPQRSELLQDLTDLALIKNIITPQIVDLRSTFWQLRLLTKARKLLESHASPCTQVEGVHIESGHYQVMRQEYLGMLFDCQKRACRWVLRLLPQLQEWSIRDPYLGILATDVLPRLDTVRSCRKVPESAELDEFALSREKERPNQKVRRRYRRLRNQKWYAALIIWYLWHHNPTIFDEDEEMKEAVRDSLAHFASLRNEDNDFGTIALDDPYTCLVRWYHSHSLVYICKKLGEEHHVNLKKHTRLMNLWQVKAEKSLRLFDQGRLIQRNFGHKVAELVKLGAEIGVSIGSLNPHCSASCLDYAKGLLVRRKPTRLVNSGKSSIRRWDPTDMRSAAPRPAPWELTCLEHHSPISLNVADNWEESMEACKLFLLSDYTFMDAWDASVLGVVGQWWDFTTSCILSTALVDNRLGPAKSSPSLLRMQSQSEAIFGPIQRAPTFEKSGSFEQDSYLRSNQLEEEQHSASLPKGWQIPGLTRAPTIQPRIEPGTQDSLDKIFQMLQDRWKSTENENQFIWRDRCPRPLYHADANVQSLGDTPNVFKVKRMGNISIRRNVSEYLKASLVDPQDWTLDQISNLLPARELRHLSCIDLSLQVDGNDLPEVERRCSKGRIELEVERASETSALASIPLVGDIRAKKDSGLWDLYFLEKPQDHPEFETSAFSPEFKDKLRNGTFRRRIFLEYQRSLFSVLNDSIVDLGTRYRILLIRNISPMLVQAMIHMWHPESLDTCDDNLGILSNFFDTTRYVYAGGDDVWTTSITISHWRLQTQYDSQIRGIEDQADQGEKKVRLEEQKSGPSDEHHARTGMAFPPKGMPGMSGKKSKQLSPEDPRAHLSTIRELSMSVVISGDRMGRYWTCSIISELLNEADIQGYSDEVKSIMQMFIHQQYTGRILVFLLLLGYLCESLAKECETFTQVLDTLMEMEPMVLLKGMEWHKSDVALKRLKRMLWGLEALRVFDDKLKGALHEITEGKQKMEKELERGQFLRQREMERDIERVQEEFSKRYNRLKNAHNSINQKTEQGSRLREGIASVLSVEQNENISMLTWVTIAYLPLAFIAGIFSMGPNIVPLSTGRTTVAWMMLVFLTGTMAFAISLQVIIGGLRRAEKRARVVTGKAYDASLGRVMGAVGDVEGGWKQVRETASGAAKSVGEVASGAVQRVNAVAAGLRRRRGRGVDVEEGMGGEAG